MVKRRLAERYLQKAMRWLSENLVWPSLCIGLLLVFGAQEARSHGSVVAEEDSCVIKIGFYRAHFSVYQPHTRHHEEFCEDLPDLGETIFVLNYLHDSMREVPVDFRIVRDKRGLGRFARIQDFSEQELLTDTVFYQQPQRQSDGVLTVLHPFNEPGSYVGVVTALNPNQDRTYVAVFPFDVDGRLPLFVIATGIGVLLVCVAGLMALRHKHGLVMSLVIFLGIGRALYSDPLSAQTNTATSESGAIVATYRSTTGEIRLNQMHSWIVALHTSSGTPVQHASITVNGRMPEHDHGLPTAPRVTQDLGDGNYLLEGLKFHMNGHWQVILSVTTADSEDTVVFDFDL